MSRATAAMSSSVLFACTSASGIVNTSYQVGSALGLAAMTAVAASQGADQLTNAGALTDGYPLATSGHAV